MQFSRQEYWTELPFPSRGDLPDPGIKPGSPTLQANSLPSELPGKLTRGLDIEKDRDDSDRGRDREMIEIQTEIEKEPTWASQVVPVVKNPLAKAGDIRDLGFIPRSGRSAGGGHGNPLQYAFLENPMKRGVWRAVVHRVAQSWIQLKQLSTQHAER